MRVCILLPLALGGLISTAFAQTYPNRIVRMVVAYPAGGSIDVVSRLVNQRLASALGQQFIVENRAGAAGRTRAVNRVPACGM